jgi:hypothetical protein
MLCDFIKMLPKISLLTGFEKNLAVAVVYLRAVAEAVMVQLAANRYYIALL